MITNFLSKKERFLLECVSHYMTKLQENKETYSQNEA